MASLNSLQMRALAAQTTGLRIAEDEGVALRITHKKANLVTHVIVSADGIELHDADGTLASGSLATLATLGAVADWINDQPNWDCRLLDALRATVTTVGSTLITGTISATQLNGEWGYSIMLDSTLAFTFAIRCAYDRTVGNGIPLAGHRVKLVSFEYVLNVNAAAADKVRIYEWDPVLRTESQIWQAASTDNTATVTTHDFSKAPITAKEGNDLIVYITDAGSITNASTNYLQALYIRE